MVLLDNQRDDDTETLRTMHRTGNSLLHSPNKEKGEPKPELKHGFYIRKRSFQFMTNRFKERTVLCRHK